jgi:hypothetical protein
METKMQLTEQQIEDRQEIFFTILSDFIEENYEVPEDYVMTEEDAYITSIVMEYFEENFKFPTLEESYLEGITNYDINTPLYEEVYYALLDETIGGFIAGAAHGIKNFLTGVKATKAKIQRDSAERRFGKHLVGGSLDKKKGLDKQTTHVDLSQKAHDTKDFGKGIIGNVKKSFSQGKIDAVKKRTDSAKQALVNARNKAKTAGDVHDLGLRNKNKLASKIDTGIKNVQNRVKQAISTGASRIGGFMGKVAGSVS